MKRSIGAKTLVYPNPVFLVGSYDLEHRPNIMVVAWSGICCSKPPCLAVSLREATYTHGNIKHNKAFTVSIPSVTQVKEADYAGVYSGLEENKFEATGLTPVKSSLVDAPYVAEFPVALECRLLHMVELGSHTQFVGEILDVKAEERVLGENGLPDIEKVIPLVYSSGNRAYYAVGQQVAPAFSIGKVK